jgi:lipid-A-disaccharide synthase-like uncharacterized protein
MLDDFAIRLQGVLSRFEWNAWKAVGLLGSLMFGLRWLVQAWASKKAGRSIVPLSFWIISVIGSSMTLAYFIFYRFDSVGMLNTGLPFAMALYNLRLTLKNQAAESGKT